MSEEPKRWSGYATQSAAWQAGYDWEYGYGEHGEMDYAEALDHLGYHHSSKEADDFERGSEFAITEQADG